MQVFDKVKNKKIIAVFFMVLLFVIVFYNYKKNDYKSVKEQWALVNWGQDVNGVKGQKGVDIDVWDIWKITRGRRNVIVAIIDSGVEINNSLKDAVYVNLNEIPNNGIDDDKNGYVDDINGWNFYNNDNNIYSDYLADYHGTAIAEIIAGKHEKNGYYGVAPGITILPVKAFCGTKGSITDVLESIDYAINQGAKIINMSWKSAKYNDELYKKMQDNSNVLFVCSSAQYDSAINDNIIHQMNYKLNNVISVGSVDCRGKIGNGGWSEDVDVLAPGKEILCALPEKDRVYMSGTSLSTAFVSGIAALMLSENSTLNPSEIKRLVISSANKNEYQLINAKEIFGMMRK